MFDRLLLALVLAGGLASAGRAADPVVADEAVAVEAAPEATYTGPATWSGFYIGALFGYSFGEADVSGRTDGGRTFDLDGVEGGAFAGANAQFDRFVVGLEGDLLASGAGGSAAGLRLDQDWEGSLRARAGIALDDFLLYGTGGLAATGVSAESGRAEDEQARLGWTLGAGVEAALTERVTARVEYRYTEYEDKAFSLDRGTPVDLGTSAIRAGVALKF